MQLEALLLSVPHSSHVPDGHSGVKLCFIADLTQSLIFLAHL